MAEDEPIQTPEPEPPSEPEFEPPSMEFIQASIDYSDTERGKK